jgi:hypothetical protein
VWSADGRDVGAVVPGLRNQGVAYWRAWRSPSLLRRQPQNHVAVAVAWAAHRTEAVDRRLVQANDHVALVGRDGGPGLRVGRQSRFDRRVGFGGDCRAQGCFVLAPGALIRHIEPHGVMAREIPDWLEKTPGTCFIFMTNIPLGSSGRRDLVHRLASIAERARLGAVGERDRLERADSGQRSTSAIKAGVDVLLPLQIATANVASGQGKRALPSDAYRRGLRPLRSPNVEVPPAASAHQTDAPLAK